MSWNVHTNSLSARYSNGRIYDFNSGRDITPLPPVSRAQEHPDEIFEELPDINALLDQHSELFDIHNAELQRPKLDQQLRDMHAMAMKYHAYAWHALRNYPDHPISMMLSGMAKGLGYNTMMKNQ